MEIFLNSIGDRLKWVRNSLGFKNQTAFAEQLGITQTALSKYEKGTIDVPDGVKIKISETGINLHWFLTGEGTPYIAPLGQDGIKAVANTQSHLPAAQSGARIPLLKQQVSCGSGVNWETEENIEEYIEVDMLIPRLGIGRVFAVKAQGSSMLGAGIRAGDYIFFDGSEEQTPQDGIYVFALDGDVYCKRLEFDRLARIIKIFSVRVADLEKAELVASLDTNDTEFSDRFRIFGRVTRCIRLIDVEER